MKHKLYLLHIYLIVSFLLLGNKSSIASIGDTATAGSIKFIENKAQWEDQIKFKTNISTGAIFFEKDQFTLNIISKESFEFYLDRHSHDSGKKTMPDLFKSHSYKMIFENASPEVEISGSERSADHKNYILGNDPSKWVSEVFSYNIVSYKGIYEGIDLKVYSSKGNLKYDYIIAPQKDPAQIAVRYEGAERLHIENGDLIITTSVNTVKELKPYAYQVIDGETHEVAVNYKLTGKVVSYEFPVGYDASEPLIIDPTLIFSTYTGSTADNWGFTATYDNNGNLYAGGIAFGIGYPVTNGAFQNTFQGGIASNDHIGCDISITKFNSTGTTALYSTYIGGSHNEIPQSIITNDAGELFILGSTGSSNFPVTSGAYSSKFKGGPSVWFTNIPYPAGLDIIVTHLNAAGTGLVASTFVGGTDNDGQSNGNYLNYNYADNGRGEIILDNLNNVYIASSTYSSDFPVSSSAAQSAKADMLDGVVFKLNYGLSNLVWSTFLGGSKDDAAYSLKIDPAKNVYVGGGTESANFPTITGGLNTTYQGGDADGFITKISNNGSQFINSTFIGTSAYDQVFILEIDSFQNIYVTGQTSGNYPVTPNNYNVPNGGQFISKLNSSLSAFDFSLRFGKGDGDPELSPTALMVDECGSIYYSGWGGGTMSSAKRNTDINISGLFVTPDAIKPTTNGSDFYILILRPDAIAVKYASYFGGSASQDHVDGGTSRFDRKGIIYQAVCASCDPQFGSYTNDFPTTIGAFSSTDNSDNCNLAAFKFEVSAFVNAEIEAIPDTTDCIPFNVQLVNKSTGATTYMWDLGDGTITGQKTPPQHTYSVTGFYTVRLIAIDSNSCNIADTAYLTIVARQGTVTSGFNYTINECDSAIVTFNNTSINGSQYNWDFGDNNYSIAQNPVHVYHTSGNYTVRLITSNPLACNLKDTTLINININILPSVKAISDSAIRACRPHTVTFSNNNINATNHIWHFEDGTTSTVANPTRTYSNLGQFNVLLIANNPNSCNLSDTFNIKITIVADSVRADYSLTQDNVCDSLTVELINQSNSNNIIWNLDGGDSSSLQSVTQKFYDSGNYTIFLIASDTSSCNMTDTLPINIDFFGREVIAGFSILTEIRSEEEFKITDESFGAEYYYYTFSDGTTSTLPEPSHSFKLGGTYEICQHVSNTFGCEDVVCKTFPATQISDIIAPTAFSPNFDNINDRYTIYVRGIDHLRLRIFNRWGEMIYETESLEDGWDGTYKNVPCEVGVYVFHLTGVKLTGEPFNIKGNITLLR